MFSVHPKKISTTSDFYCAAYDMNPD